MNGAITAAFLSVGAGAIHVALAPEHLDHWWVFGLFFLAVGAFQLAFAAAVLWRPTWPVALVGIVANLAIVLIYVASRTVGLPLVPPEEAEEGHGKARGRAHRGRGPLDLATTGAELVLIGVLVSLLPGRAARRHLQLPAARRRALGAAVRGVLG